MPNGNTVYVGTKLTRQRMLLDPIRNLRNIISVDNKIRLKCPLNRETQYGSLSIEDLLHESLLEKLVFGPR